MRHTRSYPALPAVLLALAAALAPAMAEGPAPLAIERVEDLGFGAIVASSTSGTVTVSPGGSRTSAGGVSLGSQTGVAAAVFAVSGEPSESYAIVLPDQTSLASGGNSLLVDGFTGDPATGALGLGGTQTLRVGATLQVGAQQAPGSYTGNFSVIVAYN